MRVLVVDDEPLMKRWMEGILKQSGRYEIIEGEALNGMQALKLCRIESPDVVFTDIRMPVMDGVELIRILHEEFPHIVTVVLSNYSEYPFVRQTMLHGAFDYILKLETTAADILDIMERIQCHLDKVKSVSVKNGSEMLEPFSASHVCRQILEALDYIKKYYNQDISRKEVAEYVHFNETYFSDIFKRETGLSFQVYVTYIRMEKAKWYLDESNYTVSEIAEKTGYSDAGYFSKVFRKYAGISPVEYRAKMRIEDKGEER